MTNPVPNGRYRVCHGTVHPISSSRVIRMRWTSARSFLSFALFAILLAALPARASDIVIAWDANMESDIAGYIVEYGPAAAPFTASVNVGNQTTWTLSGVTAGATYVFRVRAYNTAGEEGAPSSEVTGVVGGGTSACTTPDPFSAMGGGTCHNGGWLPPGMTPPASAPAPTSSPTPAPAPTPVVTNSGCTTPDPFTAMGGGTCANGGWLPPGMAPMEGVSTSALPPAPTPTPAPQPTSQGGCTTIDPFAGIPSLIGVCRNGGWVPVQWQTGTVRLLGGTWTIVGDDGTTYVPSTALQPTFQHDGMRVSFAGLPVTGQVGGTLIDVVAIGAL